MSRLSCIFVGMTLALAGASPSGATEGQPKYGPEAVPISRSHEYFRKAPAPDYWAIAPYYVGQQDDAACSVATTAMVVNAARRLEPLGASDELVSQAQLLERDRKGANLWASYQTHGVNLDTLGKVIEESLRNYGLKNFTVTVVHVAQVSDQSLESLRKVLIENERSAGDFLVANFIQGKLTGDTGGGHIAPIGAYDRAAKKALIMDPDRKWYEPYWVSDRTLLEAMATRDPDGGKNRGYVRVKFQFSP